MMKRLFILMHLFVLAAVLTACAPYGASTIETVAPNETAFLIPLIGDSGAQVKLQSVDFLKKNQVVAKQVEIPVHTHQTGRNPTYDVEFLPSAVLIKVDRSPVTRHWTSKSDTGTSASNQAFSLETSESIGFQLGATCSALITEENAAPFLYYFANKNLADVMDTNVRGYIQQEFFQMFGGLTLEQARTTKTKIIEQVGKDVTEKFAPMGITITSFGGEEGLIYDNANVQQSIDQVFQSQQSILNNAQLATAQAINNINMLAQANAFATATVVAGNASAAVLQANGEQLAQYPDLVAYEIAKRSQGNVPNTVVLGSGSSGTLPFAFLLNQAVPTASANSLATPMPTATQAPTQIPMATPFSQPTPTPKP